MARPEVIRLQPHPPYEITLPQFGAPPWETFGSQGLGRAQAQAAGQKHLGPTPPIGMFDPRERLPDLA